MTFTINFPAGTADRRERMRATTLALVAVTTLLCFLTVTSGGSASAKTVGSASADSVGSAATTAYRYWSYWQGASGQWVAAATGPGDHVVTDGDVQGWRFGISGQAPLAPPDNSPDFTTLCPLVANSPAPQEFVRVAVVIDSGLAADAPKGATPPVDRISCVTLPAGSTGNQALAASGEITMKNSMVCAINGYPKGECASEVSDAVAAAAAKAGASESPNPALPGPSSFDEPTTPVADDSAKPGLPVLLLTLTAILAVGGAAIFAGRRRIH